MPVLALSLIYGYKQVESYFVQPKAIFVLGGEEERELFAAKFAQKHPEIPDLGVFRGSPSMVCKAGVYEGGN
jgi:hypothetical protein